MNDWYQRMLPVLQLNGKGEPTQKACTRMVRMLSEFYGKTPDLISEPELQEYFLHRKNVNRWSPKTMRICYCGIRFFYVNVLARDWHIFSILRARTGLFGSVAAALCCLTPALVFLLGAVGLVSVAPYLDYVLMPLFGFFVLLAYYGWKRGGRIRSTTRRQ